MSITKTKSAKIWVGVLGVALALSLFVGVGVQTVSAGALTDAQVQSILGLLSSFGADQSVINNVKASLTGSAPTGTPSTSSYNFTRSLTVGSTGADVKDLQKFLNGKGFAVAASGAGSAGNETSTFGPATKAALAKFQAANGISPAVGYFGALTMAKVNAMGGSTTTTTTTTPTTTTTTTTPTTPVGSGLSVSAPEQPAASLAPYSAARVPFTKVTLTASSDGDVTVSGVTVERTGLATDANFSGLVLLDQNGTQVGIAKTLNSNHQATLSEPFVVKAGTSKTMTIAANMAAQGTVKAGEVASLTVKSVSANAPVSGVLPITGANHTINATLVIGSITNARGPLDPNGAQSKNVGTTGFTFSSIKVTAGSQEDIRVNSIRWNQASSAGASDLANLVTAVDGTSYPATVSSDGKYYTSTFGGGLVVTKGNSVEISVKGDIVGGSGRTAAFNIEKTTDINITGETFRYGITPPTSGTGFTSGTIWYPSSTITINAGSLTGEKATTVVAQNIALNQNNQVLGGFTVETLGEPISVAQTVFTIATTGTATAGSSSQITGATIVDENGAVVAGPVDASGVGDTLTFPDTLTFQVGKKTYRILGKVGPGFGNGGTVIVSTTPSTGWTTVTGQVTGKTITPSSSAVTMNTMTVKTATLTVSTSPDPVAQQIVAGAQQFTFANIQLNTLSSGEDIKLSTLAAAESGSGTVTNLTSCQLYDGNTSLTTQSGNKVQTAGAGANTFTFDTPLIVPKGVVKNLALKCNVASGSSSTYAWGVTSAPSATGQSSGQSASVTLNSSVGQTITVQTAGTLAIALDSGSPQYAIVAAGTTAEVAKYRVTGAIEPIRLTDFALALNSPGGTNNASSSPSSVTKVTLWNGANKVGEALFQGGNYVASTTIGAGTCTGCVDLIVPKDSDVIITAKVDLAEQGTSQPGTPGALVQVDWANASGDATKGVGMSSGTTIKRTAGTTSASQGVRVAKAYPKVEAVANSSKLTGRAKLYRFKVTAIGPVGSKVGIYSFKFRIATSSATSAIDLVDNVNVYAFTDSLFSSAASGLSNTDGRLARNHLGLSTIWGSSSQDLVVGVHNGTASSTLSIDAGTTMYFEVQGDTTTGSAGATYSASTQLIGDSAFRSDLTATPYTPTATSTYLATTTYLFGVDASSHNGFIWRPFSTTTSADISANDYLNGYQVVGLPAGGTDVQTVAQP